MSLLPGARLGPYEVVSPIGAGGMGEVYRAKDTNLNRDVALKILPESFALDADRVARFKREAQVLAALNHPNIAAIYGIESHALVMELVEGEDLSALIARGAIPLTEALPIAKQIADALEAAHEQGIVHRDLKPANIKVRHDGTVKVLDFGLAKALDPAGALSADAMNSPTLTARATQMGMIIGTAAYMSPEQAKGRPVDKRADIWAFGVVICEMLTGQRTFKGDDISETLASVLKDAPDFAPLPADTPASIRKLLKRCLEKDRKRRLDSAADARFEIEEAMSGAGGEPSTAPAARATPSSSRASALAWAVATIAIAAAAYFAWSASSKPAAVASPSVHAHLSLDPADALLGSDPNEIRVGSRRPSRTAIALSRDGRWLAYVGEQAGKQQMFLRDLRRDAGQAVPNTVGADNPFFSFDGKWIGFWSDGALRKVPVDGGPAVEICKVARLNGADWGADDRILFGAGGIIRTVAAGGGNPAVVATPAQAGEPWASALPRWLPGSRILYSEGLNSNFGLLSRRRLIVQHLDGSDRRVLLDDGTDGRLSDDGRYLLFLRDSTLMAVGFDRDRAEIVGQITGLMDGVMVSLNAPNTSIDVGAGQFAVDAAGTLVYLPGRSLDDGTSVLTWMDRQGRPAPISMDSTHNYLTARISPDGRRAVMGSFGREWAMWVFDFARTSLTRVPFAGSASRPIWSPDGKSIVFGGATDAGVGLFRLAADGSGVAERLSAEAHSPIAADWSHDGKELVYVDYVNGPLDAHVFALSLADKKTRVLVQTSGRDDFPAVSPDGRWLAYVSTPSNRSEVFVKPYDGGERVQVSLSGGDSPRWTRDGKELIFKLSTNAGRSTFWSVAVAPGATFSAGTPRLIGEVSQSDFGNGSPTAPYDVAADGRLLGATRRYVTPPPGNVLHIVTNWFDELRAKVK